MPRHLLTLLAPPAAVCRFGCPGCCAAPIAVFWLAGLAAIAYAVLGGPEGAGGPNAGTLALGAGLWLAAWVWAGLKLPAGAAQIWAPSPVRSARGATMSLRLTPRASAAALAT